MAVSQNHGKNLERLALFISTDVKQAMRAAYVGFIAGSMFNKFSEEERRTVFRTNPANTLTSAALGALVSKSVVCISETLKDEHGLHPVNVEIRRKADLSLHRHFRCHPMTVDWRKPEMKDFADGDRAWHEYLPALVWDANRSINEELRKLDLAPQNESIEVTWEMAVSLHTILEMSLNPEAINAELPSREELLWFLQDNVTKYQADLEKHPDGFRDHEKEKERVANKRARWEALRLGRATKTPPPP
jgi:hypothetical protein